MTLLKAHTARRVNLFGIGAPRTATSSLAWMLRGTGKVFVPEAKEMNGFGIDADVTESVYEMRFSEARTEHRYLADISPVYLSSIQVAEGIQAYNPEAKIIATLRDPVSRVISHYRHMKGKIDPSLGPELKLNINSYIRKGLADIYDNKLEYNSWYSAAMNINHSFYGKHLQSYYRRFPHNQILVLVYDDLTRWRPFRQGLWARQLQRFLGVNVNQKCRDNRAVGFETKIADDVAVDLKKLFAADVSTTSDLIGRDLGRLWGY
ncbi:sulfotransferase [Mesorhizobium sp. M1406]|uniref:sulfotransferase family protein n=1 Tax=Mesorhizobium sp. M1406 TaxID=2957099 RepID=UPI0033388235